ncbi:purine-nucleoside phosphorylase [Spiribacter insolitus]|uniref:Purine nucleoside phosphorylase DeoD-type n=1 Tax=Spiribacter insolitus TaxID=3122417 RepID=A0ABV3T5D4_9GAMM
MATPHISAEPGDFAETVLMPGDPLRARVIAENYLEDVREVTSTRNMLGFTGRYGDTPVSVMGSGMGIPSMSIYAFELFNEYRVEKIIRVGTCGGVRPDVEVRDIIIAMGASTDSSVNRTRFGGCDFAAIADYGLLEATVGAARSAGIAPRIGNVFSSELFYNPTPSFFDMMKAHGILAVEMEAAGLYGAAAEAGKRAVSVLTVSDHVVTGASTSAEERQNSFQDMMKVALEAAVNAD